MKSVRTCILQPAFYSKNVNNRTIKLFDNYLDYSNGINTVGFTTINTQGTHKFRLYEGKTTLKRINVIDPGTDFENRILDYQSGKRVLYPKSLPRDFLIGELM